MSSSHIRLYFSTARAKRMASGRNQPGPQSSARRDLVAEHLLHGDDAVDHVRHAALADLPLVHRAVIARLGWRHAVVEVVGTLSFMLEWKLMPCLTMKKFSGRSIIHLTSAA